MTESQSPIPEEPNDLPGTPASANGSGAGGDGPPAQLTENGSAPEAEPDDTGPPFQADVIAVGNFAMCLVVVAALKSAYDTQRGWPVLYLVVLGLVIAVYLGSQSDSAARWFQSRFDWMGSGDNEEWTPGPSWRAFITWRDDHRGAIVYVLAGLTVLSLLALIINTGLGIESPFIPFVTAPAVFGPFVAKNSTRVSILVVTVTVLLTLILAAVPSSPCGINHCPPPARADLVACGAQPQRAPTEAVLHCADERVLARFHPHQWLYWLTSVIVLFVAGFIAARRLRTEHGLRAEIRELKAALGPGAAS